MISGTLSHFTSKSLNDVEWNYEIHDKEMLAIIQALEEWRHFLEGLQHKFEIWTNHKNPRILHDCEEAQSADRHSGPCICLNSIS